MIFVICAITKLVFNLIIFIMLTKKLKLSTLSEALLKDKEMGSLYGGDRTCDCSCYYQGQPGGSSSSSNIGDYGGDSVQGCNQYHYNPGSYPSAESLIASNGGPTIKP